MATKPKLNLASFTGVVSAASGTTTAPDAEVEMKLIDVERQVRTELGDLTDLAKSISDIGVLEPILLLAKDDGRYRLIAGERRLRASQLANATRIPALIKRGLSETQIRQIQVIENMEREDLSAFDEAMGVADDAEKFGFKEAQRIWNRSESWVSKRVAVKKYAEPVSALLMKDLCGDLEVLHSLNQLFEASNDEFVQMAHRLKAGQTLSRDDARNKVASVKAYKKQQAEFEKIRAAAKSPPKQEKVPKWLEAQRKKDAESLAASDAHDSTTAASDENTGEYLAPVGPTDEEEAADERQRLESAVKMMRSEIFEWGDTNLAQFNSIQSKMTELEFGMNEAEWVMWSGFQSMVLPMMHALGNERSLAYIKRLQSEFKTKTPILMWREQHSLADGADPNDEFPARIEVPSMPTDWRF